jgi:probable FeS assembly SUF system protein SufT
MNSNDPIILTRDCEAAVVPLGTQVTLKQGETAYITQSLGGSHTVIVNGNLFRIDGRNADALGLKVEERRATRPVGQPVTEEELTKEVWDQLKTCYDPEIPVNIVDLGLIYGCELKRVEGGNGGYRAEVKMTLTAPGCGMGDHLRHDVMNKLMCLEEIEDANVELVWEPQWNQGLMTEAARLQLGLY